MKLLISVRNLAEALLAGGGGADFIDLKEPARGALGGLDPVDIASIVAGLRNAGIGLPISATIGDWPAGERAGVLARVAAVAGCGVDYVKVGIERGSAAIGLLDALAACDAAIVPVFIADAGLDPLALAHACSLPFPGVMVDTAAKRAGSLFDLADAAVLRDFVDGARAQRKLVGLAGALRITHREALVQLAPDFAGFRSAVCAGDRSGALDAQCLSRLVAAMHAGTRLPA